MYGATVCVAEWDCFDGWSCGQMQGSLLEDELRVA